MRSVSVVVFVVARLALSSMSQQEEAGDIWARGMTIEVSNLEKYEAPPCSGEWPTSWTGRSVPNGGAGGDMTCDQSHTPTSCFVG